MGDVKVDESEDCFFWRGAFFLFLGGIAGAWREIALHPDLSERHGERKRKITISKRTRFSRAVISHEGEKTGGQIERELSIAKVESPLTMN